MRSGSNNYIHPSYNQYLIPSSGDLRKDIYNFISKNPGIRYRELIRLAGISNGVLTYHLCLLEKSGEIKVERLSNKKVTRYFVANIPKEDSDIISCLRGKVIRNIIFFVLENEFCTFSEIVDHVGKAPSTISWHIKKLREAGILGTNYGNDRQLYSVADRTTVNRILLEYKQTFTDRIIENYTEMIDSL
ncbi:MAG: winged helix-turn-helix transcriptional regulator [Nitrososphaeraceae archaeon]